MKLRMNRWKKSKVGELTLIKGGKRLPKGQTLVNYKTDYPYIRVTDFEKNSVNKDTLLYLLEDDYKKIKNYFITKDDVFISIAGTIGLIGIIPEDLDGANLTENAAKLVIKNDKILNQHYLLHSLLSPNLQGQIRSGTATTAQPKLGLNKIANLEIPLPPLEEQKQIAALFQSIDTAIEEVEGQERNLKALRKSLINKITKQGPLFGNLIAKSNCKEYLFGDLAVEVPDRTDNPQNSGFEKFIGLEDFESGELIIQRFSSTDKLVSAMKLCKKGDILFARRNAYLKRASITEFDAVCSGDVIVMRANEKIILPMFLILVMNTDEFWEFAISNAAGTMSKRVKWRDLATYSLELPDLKIQSKILEIFSHLETTISRLRQQKTTLQHLKQKLLSEILG
jgi:type I restriction enzyme S subunit